MNILLNESGRFGNYILSIIHIINKYQLYKYNNKDFKIYVTQYKTELSKLFDFPVYNFDSTNQNKNDFICEHSIFCQNIKDINDTLLLKNIDKFTLYCKSNNKYSKVQYDNIIHLRLGDYLNSENRCLGYHYLTDKYLSYIINKYDLNMNNCCIITDNINNYKQYCNDYNLNVYSNSLLEDFVSMMYCKNLFCSCSTFSISAGIIGHCKNVYVPYPYIINNEDFNKKHLFLYNNEKIIKIPI